MAYGMLVPQSGMEARPSATTVCSSDHWTAREFPRINILNRKKIKLKSEN